MVNRTPKDAPCSKPQSASHIHEPPSKISSRLTLCNEDASDIFVACLLRIRSSRFGVGDGLALDGGTCRMVIHFDVVNRILNMVCRTVGPLQIER
jgi:hypothetical protein